MNSARMSEQTSLIKAGEQKPEVIKEEKSAESKDQFKSYQKLGPEKKNSSSRVSPSEGRKKNYGNAESGIAQQRRKMLSLQNNNQDARKLY